MKGKYFANVPAFYCSTFLKIKHSLYYLVTTCKLEDMEEARDERGTRVSGLGVTWCQMVESHWGAGPLAGRGTGDQLVTQSNCV